MGKKSKRAKKKPAPVKAPDKKNGLLSAIVQHPIISLLVILATFIALYFAIYPRSDEQLNGKIDKIAHEAEYLTNALGNQTIPECALAVYPYASPTPKQPFETDFILENKGAFGVRDVTCDFLAKKIVYPSGYTMTDLGGGGGIKIMELHAGQQTTLHSSSGHFIISQNPIAYAELEITINFFDARLPTNQISRSFYFFTKKQESGILIWYPMGQ